MVHLFKKLHIQHLESLLNQKRYRIFVCVFFWLFVLKLNIFLNHCIHTKIYLFLISAFHSKAVNQINVDYCQENIFEQSP